MLHEWISSKPLTSLPSLLASSVAFVTIALSLRWHLLKSSRPLPFSRELIRFNNISYSLLSFCLFLGLLSDVSLTSSLDIVVFVCPSRSPSKFDTILRYIFHVSKVYEYVDIFLVLAICASPGINFAFHHTTTPYLTYARVIRHPVGWNIFAILNTLHHTIMYAYFGGVSMFSPVLPFTGLLQLIVGSFTEVYIILDLQRGSGACGGEDALWAHALALVLFSLYTVLLARDLRNRREKKTE